MDFSDPTDCLSKSSGELSYKVLTEEDVLLEKLKQIEPVVRLVVQSSEELFSVAKNKRGDNTLQATQLGKLLLKALKNGSGEFHCYFPFHSLNPYVALLFECAEKFDSVLVLSSTTKLAPSEVEKEVEILNGLVGLLRVGASGHGFKALIKRFIRAEKKRAHSLDQYIDALFEKHSRMVVIRVDLYYQPGFFNERKNLQLDLARVNADWEKLRKDLHKGLPIKGMLGFACKLEYGHLKGFHFHLLVFYNGAVYREDVVLASLVGKHWAQKVTGGQGRYFNCNKKKKEYRLLGVGMIGWSNKELVSNLKTVVAPYLIKTDYWLRFSINCGRSFFRGNMPKSEGVRRGRPRRVN
ncbi:inovirus Gp2 family protein [Pseudomonas sp. CVAP|uniref:YagK/YfjJ domain-containing protein n=1 Tax=Pseudomonas sp. CVAP\|nr:inovirus-type Gp2 protein [Pseudomonas sp. CVAP\